MHARASENTPIMLIALQKTVNNADAVLKLENMHSYAPENRALLMRNYVCALI